MVAFAWSYDDMPGVDKIPTDPRFRPVKQKLHRSRMSRKDRKKMDDGARKEQVSESSSLPSSLHRTMKLYLCLFGFHSCPLMSSHMTCVELFIIELRITLVR